MGKEIMNQKILKILNEGTASQIKALFLFNKEDEDETIYKKFLIWSRWFFPQYFPSKDALFHKKMDYGNIGVYKSGGSFLDIGFRGCSKTTRTKLFVAFCIANDEGHYRKYFKVLSKELDNAKQATTDVYNILVSQRVRALYSEIFQKTVAKREETMSSFTTSTGIKMTADTIGTDQRGDIQDESRPDFIWFEDFETRMSLMSAVTTHKIWQNMEEAKNGLSKDGGMIFNCFSEETKFITSEGAKSFNDFESGDIIKVLTHKGNWKKAIVRDYGLQKLRKIKFSRGRRNNIEIWATANHSWILHNGERTTDLKTGDRVLNSPNIFDEFIYEEASPEERLYWAYGYVYGDGSILKNRKGEYCYSMVRICGRDREKFLNRFQELGFKTSTSLSLNGDYCAYTGRYLKTLPNPKTDKPNLIRAFVRGFLDADGIKGEKKYRSPFVQMVQTNKWGAINFIRKYFPIAGVFITYEKKIGGEIVGNKVRDSSTMRFGLGSNFVSNHPNGQFTAFLTGEKKKEQAWCLEVKDDHSFILNEGIATGNCNYISERGNVHKLVKKIKNQLIVPLEVNGEPTWPERYTKDDVLKIKNEAEDYEGEFQCKPSASKDVYFDRESIDKQTSKQPIEEIAGLKIFKKYDPSHRIGSGHDVAGGVGLDSSTSVFMDFDVIPNEVIATFSNNEIKPDVFAYEIAKQGKRFGENLVAVEKNYGSTIDILKTIYPTDKIFKTERTPKIVFQSPIEYGFETNAMTKPMILSDLAKAIEDGLLQLNDRELIEELRSYSRNDLMDRSIDPRLTTRHWDLLMACAIAWRLRNFVKSIERPESYDPWEQRKMEQDGKNPAR